MKFHLIVANGKSEGQRIPVKGPEFLIGRDKTCQLRPNSSMVSKRHCVFEVSETTVILRDLESTNGTVVNGDPVTEDVILRTGDIIRIGPLTFRVDLGEPAPKKPAKPDKKVAGKKKKSAPSHEDEDAFAQFLLEDDEDEYGEERDPGDAFDDLGHTQHELDNTELNDLLGDDDEPPPAPKAPSKANDAKSAEASKRDEMLNKLVKRRPSS